MSETLQQTAAEVNPDDLPFLVNAQRAEKIKTSMAVTPDLMKRGQLTINYAMELLNAGETEKAIEALEALEKEVRAADPALWDQAHYSTRLCLGLAYLRLGEQQNCCAANTADSCLLPLRGRGLHTKQQGSGRAMEIFTELLRERPQDLEARWLLNIAAMTLNRYPSGVPEAMRISPSVFRSEYPLPAFRNVAPDVGINLLGRSGGVVIEDLDGDGMLDIMVSGIGFQDQLRILINDGQGRFVDRTAESGIVGETGGLNLIHADYDNDGLPDVLVLRGGWMGKAGKFPFSLLKNLGNGKFRDVTRAAGLFRRGPTQTAVWLDYNNDGLLDLFVAFESTTDNEHPCALYRNNGDGTFTDVAREAGVDFVGYVKAAVSSDYDNDGYPDIFLSLGGKIGGRSVLFHNNGNGTFTNVAEKAGVDNSIQNFSAFFFDYDNDGWDDLFVTGYHVEGVADVAADYLGLPSTGARSHLYHNNRDGTFTDVSQQAHLNRVILGMGINFGDLDNDGNEDFYVGTGDPNLNTIVPNRMFRNNGAGVFQEVTTAGNFGHLQKGHAIAFADINNDGQQDVFCQMGGAAFGDTAYSALFANPGSPNHWITLKLEGVKTNRSAIGARIKVVVRNGSKERAIYRTVSTGSSFGSKPLRQEIGIGTATKIDRVEIFWPASRTKQIIEHLSPDRFYSVREGDKQAAPLRLRSFKWPAAK